MRKNRHNEQGFGVVEVLLIIIIASGVSLAGWFIVQIHGTAHPQVTTNSKI